MMTQEAHRIDEMDGLHSTRRPLTQNDFDRMNFGKRFYGVSLKNIPDDLPHKSEVLTYLKKLNYMIENGNGLLLHGPHDTGKTAIACIIGKEARRRNFRVFFIELSEIMDSTIRKLPFDDYETIEERCKSVDLLIVDDLGKEHQSEKGDFVEREIEELIRARYNDLKATIITTNLNKLEAMEAYKTSMLSMFKDSIYSIEVDGIDFRELNGQLLKEEMNGTDG